MTIIFCHGFGYTIRFWDTLSLYFSKERCFFVDLGYFNPPIHPVCTDKVVGIGHSIGLSKLAATPQPFYALVGLNGFTHFLGPDVLYTQRCKELHAMTLSLKSNPIRTLTHFYHRCNAVDLLKYCDFSNLNLERLLSDIEWLKRQHTLPQVPTLILSNNNDPIVPYAVTLNNFLHQPRVCHSIKTVGHALGFKKPEIVYKKIMDFLDAIP